MIRFKQAVELTCRGRSLPWLLFWGGFGTCLIGFVLNRMWHSVSWGGVHLLAGLAVLSLVLGYLIHRLGKLSMATSVAVPWLIALLYYAGFASFAAVGLIALASMALGSLAVRTDSASPAALSVLAGLALVSGVVGWLLPFPVHYRACYLLLTLVVVILRWRRITPMLHSLSSDWRDAVEGAPALACLAVMVVGMISTCAWMPTIHYDDLAYHLGLPSQLVRLGYYPMSAGSSLWAVAPWAADALQGIAWLLAGHESRGAMDMLWLILTLTLMWKLSEALDLPPWARWLAVALYASLPMTAGTLVGMQTEGPTAAVTVGLALLVLRSSIGDRRALSVMALLFGLLLALKISNLMVIGPMGLWLLCRWRSRLPWRALPLAALLVLLVAGSSYVYAWVLTGNPVLPVFNAVFHSIYYTPTNFHDSRWNAGFHWNILWNLVFHTSRYAEASDGASGFALIALCGSLLAALFHRRARPVALVGLLALILPLTQIQYLRYTHQAFTLLIPAALCGVPLFATDKLGVRVAAVALVLLVAANLAFVSSGDWQLRDGALRNFLTQTQQEFTDHYAPVYGIVDFVNSHYSDSARVLITTPEQPFAGDFGGRAFVVNWYDQQLSARAAIANRDPSGVAWEQLLDFTGANLLVLQRGGVSAGLTAAMKASQAALVHQNGNLQLWSIERHVLTGVSRTNPDGTFSVNFDASGSLSGPSLVRARMEMRCNLQDVPIAVGWKFDTQTDKPWAYHVWVNCLDDGTAVAALDLAVPRKIDGVTAEVRLVKPLDGELTMKAAQVVERHDLAAERDLASAMRRRIRQAVANRFDPWRASGIWRKGVPMASSAHSASVDFDTANAPSGRALMRAKLVLRCTRQASPIALEWKTVEANAAPRSQYASATCEDDGFAHATFQGKTAGRITSFSVIATSPQTVDTALQLAHAEVAYLSNSRQGGIVARKRIKLTRWLAPEPEIRQVTP